jgi:hypothetical protein
VNKSTDDFVEIPRWVRRLNSGLWYEGPGASRRQAHILEVFAIGCGIVFLVTSFFVPLHFVATVFRVAASFSLVCGYALSVKNRVVDTYKAWPATEISMWKWRPVRTLRGTVFDYTFVLLVLILFCAVALWLAR